MNTTLNHQQSAVSLLHKNFLQASLAKQGAFMSENLHPEFIFTSPKAVILSKETYTSKLVMNPDVQFEVFEIKDEEKIAISGTAAVLSGIGRAKFKDKDELLIRITSTLVYEDAHWQLLAMQETYIP